MKTIALMLLPILLAGPLAAGEATTAEAPNPALLDPAKATETAPELFKVRLETTEGEVVIEVHREWAPNGVDRFYNLVRMGYYDGTAFYRVVGGFMAQIGMHGDPAVNSKWSLAPIEDDPVKQSNTRGMVTFAMRGSPNSRTSQFFINYGDNSYLDKMRFAPFGTVVEGMDIVDSLHSGYGEGAPRGRGPSQAEIAKRGNEYLSADFPELDYIEHATILQ